MKAALTQLNAVPGVIGSLCCDGDGHLRIHAFPPRFSAELLAEVAQTVADGAHGLALADHPARGLELRFETARVLVRPCGGGHLLVMSDRSTSPQLLAVAMGVAAKKLERLLAAPADDDVQIVEDVAVQPLEPPAQRTGALGRLGAWLARAAVSAAAGPRPEPGDPSKPFDPDDITHYDT
jgi:predicted regulator of Ras-like GTPase activity (Roadblock/LC7/MglB family)